MLDPLCLSIQQDTSLFYMLVWLMAELVCPHQLSNNLSTDKSLFV